MNFSVGQSDIFIMNSAALLHVAILYKVAGRSDLYIALCHSSYQVNCINKTS